MGSRNYTGAVLESARGPSPAPGRRPRFSTISDVEVDALYDASDLVGPGRGGGGPTVVDHQGRKLPAGRWDDFDLARDIGRPGAPPFTRGIHAAGYRSRLWTMRMFAGFGAAEDTNARFRQLLDAGQTGLSIAYDMPTLYGYDTDDPEAQGEFGTCGVAVSSLADMEVLLGGPAARPHQHVDDHQQSGRADLGHVHRRRGEARRAPRGPGRHDSRTTSSRSSWPRRSSSSRRSRRSAS